MKNKPTKDFTAALHRLADVLDAGGNATDLAERIGRMSSPFWEEFWCAATVPYAKSMFAKTYPDPKGPPVECFTPKRKSELTDAQVERKTLLTSFTVVIESITRSAPVPDAARRLRSIADALVVASKGKPGRIPDTDPDLDRRIYESRDAGTPYEEIGRLFNLTVDEAKAARHRHYKRM